MYKFFDLLIQIFSLLIKIFTTMDYYEKFCEMKKGESFFMTDFLCNFRFTKIEDYLFLIQIDIYIKNLDKHERFTKTTTTISASLIAEKLRTI